MNAKNRGNCCVDSNGVCRSLGLPFGACLACNRVDGVDNCSVFGVVWLWVVLNVVRYLLLFLLFYICI